MRYRIETDSLGEIKIPAEAYYGINTARSANNFAITKRSINRQMIKSLTIVKKAAAKANMDALEISPEVAEAIIASCDEILNGRLHGQFITDLIQGGAGYSMNMNANEVIANRANEMLGGSKGTYEFVHQLDHVNLNQTINDVIPTASKIALTKQIKKLQVELKKLKDTFSSKAKELLNAELDELGQMFNASSSALARDLKRLDQAIASLSELNMGAQILGENNIVNQKYAKKIVYYINKYSGEEFEKAKDLVDATRNFDAYVYTSSVLKILATNLSKIATDFMSCMAYSLYGVDKLNIPLIQENPKKHFMNFETLDVVKQISFFVEGLDLTITKIDYTNTTFRNILKYQLVLPNVNVYFDLFYLVIVIITFTFKIQTILKKLTSNMFYYTI